MSVYVVITRYMKGVQDEAIFSSMQLARSYLTQRGPQGRPDIVEVGVLGDIEEPNKVFTASSYDRSLDVHQFEGVYGSYDGAKSAAGEKGLVLARNVDERAHPG